MRIQDLIARHQGEDVYIVGTGPSMRTFPVDYLAGRVTLGLNQVWKYATPTWSPTYTLTVHPELLVEYNEAAYKPKTQWIVKKKAPLFEQLTLEDPTHYVFHTRDDIEVMLARPPVPDTLFIGRGVQQTAMHLAAIMAARAVVLVGVDMGELDGTHHGHDQHVRWLGQQPKSVYAEYRAWTRKARRILRDVWQVPVLTLSPLLGLTAADEDYKYLSKELKLKRLPKPKDVSPPKKR